MEAGKLIKAKVFIILYLQEELENNNKRLSNIIQSKNKANNDSEAILKQKERIQNEIDDINQKIFKLNQNYKDEKDKLDKEIEEENSKLKNIYSDYKSKKETAKKLKEICKQYKNWKDNANEQISVNESY